MTDREKLISLFLEFGIGAEFHDYDNDIRCMCGNAKIDGYNGFYTMFEFDKDGKFVLMGAWE